MGIISLPVPSSFGAPEKFSKWRPYQEQAVHNALDGVGSRFIAQVQPTGSGKSLCYVMAAVLSGKRTVILTSTKALQDQVMADFGGAFGLVDVRGQSAYRCLYDPGVTCEEGLCHAGMRCTLKGGGCLYYDAVRRAAGAQVVVTNYAFWLTTGRLAEDRLGKVDLLVLDEAHDAPEWVMRSVSASLNESAMEHDLGCEMPEGSDPGKWNEWARAVRTQVQDEMKEIAKHLETGHSVGLASKAGRLRRYERALDNIGRIAADNMVVDRDSVHGYVLVEPVSAVNLAESLLFRGVPRVLLTSATIRPKTLWMMGISPGDCAIEEYPSQFPAARRPVIWVPTTRVQHDMTEAQERVWIAQIDNILRERQDRKGIVHSVSYLRAKRILQLSEHAGHMLLHDRKTTARTIALFKGMPPPAYLVSPSVTTGYDFPLEQAELQILAKVCFPDSRAASLKARVKHDPEYAYYLTMQQVVQASGRGMRSLEDQCEVFVVDDHWQWFFNRYKKFAPKWFTEACRTCRVIPKPLAKLGGR